jgi:ferrochelatase
MKKTILLINLGTPDSCHPRSVRAYLREFLNDVRVIDLPIYIRWPLVNLGIIPFRYRKTALAYQKIWTETGGSPLFHFTQQQQQLLSDLLGKDYRVEFAMRYGHPSIQDVLANMQNVSSLTILPLFPQYASAATGSVLQQVLNVYAKRWNIPQLNMINEFYHHPAFIKSYVELLNKHLAHQTIDKLIFSYHGLPLRHIDKSQCQAVCDRIEACPDINQDNAFCYRAQCMQTSRLIAAELQLASSQYVSAFQSRLGRTPWIKPYTDLVLPELIQQGIKRIAIVSPSFVADCLETLEEINIRLRAQWLSLGGADFIFIPSLNTETSWIKAMAEIVSARTL